MSLDITSLVIRTASDGIDAAANSLNKLVEAAEKAEKVVVNVGTSSKKTNESSKESVTQIEKLMQKYQTQADLLGKNVAEMNAYNVALKGGNAAHQSAAAILGAEVDAYKELSKAQSQAIVENARFNREREASAKQAQADLAKQVKQEAELRALNEAGFRAQEYRKLQEAARLLREETNALAAAEARRKAIQQSRDMEVYIQQGRDYAAAHAEAIRMNNAFDASLRNTTTSTRNLTTATHAHNSSMQEAHSLARGLSVSLGAMWAMHGNLAGNLAGFAIGQSLKSIVSIGRDVESTLESIRARGNETTDSVNQMRQAISDLGKGVYGPQEVAKAFETLILAGLNANQALSAINSTMNLAVAGSTSIEKAASTLVSVGTSIGYVAEGYNRVGDVISKTAALSMSSVETLSEAFKSASSVASLYGVTLEDIGTSLGVLSNLGIQGSAAGTALKNMYKELNSEADKVQKTMKQLKLSEMSFKDSEGNFKPLLTVIKELDVAMSKLSANEEAHAKARLSNERGLRLLIGALDQYRIKTAEGGNALAEFQENVTNSYGFMAKAAVQMSLTADNQMKMVVNSMKTGFADAFTTIQPEIIGISSRLKEAFQSEGFKEGLRGLAMLFANIAETLANNIPVVVKLAEAFVVLKAGFIAASVWQAAAAGVIAVRDAMLGLSTATAAVNAAMGAIGVAVGLATLAWMAYRTAQEDSNKAQKAAIDYSKGYIEGIRAEADNLEKVNEKLREGIALKDVQKKVDSDNSRLLQIQKEADAVAEARKNLKDAQDAIANSTFFKDDMEKTSKLFLAKKALADAEEHQRQSAIAAFDEELRLNRLAKENAELVLQAQKNARGGRDEPTMSLVTEKNKAQGLSAIEAQLAALRLADEEQKRMILSEVKLYDEAYSNKKMTVFDYVAKSEDAYDRLGQQITKTYLKEANAILESRNLSTRTEAERNSLDKQRFDLAAKYTDDIVKNEEKRKKNSELLSSLAAKEFSAQEDANAKSIESTQKSIAAVEAKIFAYNRLPETLKKVGVTEKQLQDEMTQYSINSMKAEMEQLVENNNITDPLIKQRLEYLRQEIVLKERLRDDQSELEKLQAANKAAQEYATAWKQMNKQIGDDLASAIIDGGGKGWKKLITDMKLAFAKLVLQPIIAPISAGFADMFTTTGASSSGAALKSIDVAASASKLYSSLTAGLSSIGTYVADGVQSALYAAGLSKNLLSNGSFATGAGALASVGTSAFGGLTLGNAISGGFGSNSLVNLGTGAGAVASIASSLGLIGSAGGPLTALIGGAIGGLLNRAFGMGSKNVSAQGISGTIADSGVSGISYADWTQKGGWFRSDKSGRDSNTLSADIINSFTSGLTTLKATSSDFAKNLNVSSDALKDYSKSFDIQFVGLKEVKGTAAEQAAIIQSNAKIQQEAITKFFTEMGDDMATKLIPNIQEFAKSGETASATLQRLSDVFSATNQIVEILQKDMTTAFGGIGLESAKARQYLVDLAGGISNLNSQVSYYATNFLTDAEKLAPVQKALSKAMSELGYGSVTTIADFKDIVKKLDLTDQAQARTFDSLMQLAPAFKQVTDAVDAATKAAKDQADAEAKIAQEKIAAKKAAELAAFNELKGVAQGDFNVLSKSIAKAKADAQAAYDAQAAALNAQITALQATSTSITQLVSSLDSSLNTLLTNTVMGMNQATARATLDNVLATAKATGVLPTADSLKDTLSVLSKGDSSKYSSYTDYVKDMAITAGKMAELRDLSKDQGSVVEQQLQAAKDQLSFAKDALDKELAKYDAILETAQQQLDAMNGNTIAVKDMTSALLAFMQSSSKAISTGISTGNLTSGTPAATKDQITSLYQSLLNRAPDEGGMAFYLNNAYTKGTTALEIAQSILTSPEYASLQVNGSHANGLDNVPFDGYTAKLHKGEMVLPAKQANNVAQGDDIAAVVEKLTQLCEENGAENRAINSELVKIRKILVNVTPTNDRFQVHEVGAA